jgi:hypothetical protein
MQYPQKVQPSLAPASADRRCKSLGTQTQDFEFKNMHVGQTTESQR